jgi:hypothetical protein
MAGSILDWNHLYSQALQHLVPGGWIEVQEFDVWFYSQTPRGLEEDSAIMKWQRLIDHASMSIGMRLNCGEGLGRVIGEAGFAGVRSRVIKVCFLPSLFVCLGWGNWFADGCRHR